MTIKYTVKAADPDTLTKEMIIRENEDGSISSIPVDPSNADYQAYLNKDNPDYGNKL
jgi:hypothetical protein